MENAISTPALDDLVRRVRNCRLCIACPEGPALPHEPRPVVVASSVARILIAGQAPGLRVHETRIAFNDRSGERLRAWLGVTRDEFYDPASFAIVPMGFCFPGYDARGADLPPRRECAPAWRTQLLRAMPRIELVLAVGQYAQMWHLGRRGGRTLTETVRNWRATMGGEGVPIVLPLPHPSWRNSAWLKANPWFENDLLPALRHEIAIRMRPQNQGATTA